MRWVTLILLLAILSTGCGGDPPKGSGEPPPFPDQPAAPDVNRQKPGPGFN